MRVSSQPYAPVASTLGYQCRGGWVGPRAHLSQWWGRGFFLRHRIQADYVVHPACCPEIFLRGWRGRGM